MTAIQLSVPPSPQEVIVRPAPIATVLMLAFLAACASGGPRQYGQYTALSPKVAAAPNERAPLHVTVELAQSSNVAVFLVTPGRGTLLLFPDDSAASSHVDAGSHQLATSLARRVARGDSGILRRPGEIGGLPTRGRGGRPGGVIADTSMLGRNGFGQRSFLLVYATDQPLSYTALSDRVAALTIPAEDTEALNTVTKLIRDTTRGGAWAAFATEYAP